MPKLMFDDDKPSREDIRRDALSQMRADAERAHRETDKRNLDLINNDPQLRRLMTAYRQLDAAGRDIVMYTAEELVSAGCTK